MLTSALSPHLLCCTPSYAQPGTPLLSPASKLRASVSTPAAALSALPLYLSSLLPVATASSPPPVALARPAMKLFRPRVRTVVLAAVVTATVGRAGLLCSLSSAARAPQGTDRADDEAATRPRLASLLAVASGGGRRERLALAATVRLAFDASTSSESVLHAAATGRPWAAQRRLHASLSADEEEADAVGQPGAGGGASAGAVDGAASDAATAGTGGGSPPEASIAYFLQVSSENVRLLPRLVRAVYHPDNVYAVHFDVKISAADVLAATQGMAAVLDGRDGARQRPITSTTPTSESSFRPVLPANIHLMVRRTITYRGVTTVLNTLDGMELLTSRGAHWDYFINLSAADYPLLSVTAVRRLLGRPDVQKRAANFLTFHPAESWEATTTSRFSRMTLDLGVAAPAGAAARLAPAAAASGPAGQAATNAASLVPGASSPNGGVAWNTGATPESPLFRTGVDNPLLASRRGPLAKGGAWMILTRSFVIHALTSSDARRALLTVSTGLSASEHFFPTLLAASPVYWPTIVPHGLRAVYWDAPPPPKPTEEPVPVVQHPRVLDMDSHQGVASGGGGGDDFLNRVASCPYLFARKFSRPTSPLLTYVDTHMNGLAGAAADESAVNEVTERANRHMDWLLAEAPLPARVTV